MPQRKWEKPELIVLVKGKPEECVLLNCKTWYSWDTYKNSAHYYDSCAGNYYNYCPTGSGEGVFNTCQQPKCSAVATS